MLRFAEAIFVLQLFARLRIKLAQSLYTKQNRCAACTEVTEGTAVLSALRLALAAPNYAIIQTLAVIA